MAPYSLDPPFHLLLPPLSAAGPHYSKPLSPTMSMATLCSPVHSVMGLLTSEGMPDIQPPRFLSPPPGTTVSVRSSEQWTASTLKTSKSGKESLSLPEGHSWVAMKVSGQGKLCREGRARGAEEEQKDRVSSGKHGW